MFAPIVQHRPHRQDNTLMKSDAMTTNDTTRLESSFNLHSTAIFEPTPLIDTDVDCIVNAVDHLFEFDGVALDPTPIGSSGLKIVDKVNLNLSESPWLDDENFVACLTSFLGQKRKSVTSEIQKKWTKQQQQQQATTVVEFPSNKRQRLVESTVSTVVSTDDSSSDSSTASGSTISTTDDSSMLQLRPYQSDQWYEKYRKLVQFKRINGHCLVPNNWNLNSPLALWVKRQRYQYKLKNEGQHSTLTDEREAALEALGFVWDSHGAVWEERLNELRAFKNVRGHCCVPANFKENHQLAIWVKCQRRQYKLFCDGKRSNMTQERITKLVDLGFVWNPRKMKASSSSGTFVPDN